MKLQFYTPRVDEYEAYQVYYRQCIQLCSESSFWALWEMSHTMGAERAFSNNFYWHRVQWHDKLLWMPPIGDWDSVNWEELLTEVVPPGTLFGYMPEYLVNKWVAGFAAKIGTLEPMDSESDYLYYTVRQRALEGKPYADMRGAINRFTTRFEAQSEFRFIEPEDIPAIKQFELWWINENRRLGKACEDLEIEHKMNMCILDMWPLQDMKGAVLFIDGTIAGYTIISELDTYAAEGHVLRANYEYAGIYQYMINKIYNVLLKEYTIFNAWGDGGLEGLRKTKLSQNPLIKINKFLISWEG